MNVYLLSAFLFCCFVTKGNCQFTVATCADVIQVYNQVGYPVIDCLLQNDDPMFPLLFWRLDAKVTFNVARAACKVIQDADLATVHTSSDLRALNSLNEGKFILNTWMWLGATKVNGSFTWVDGPIAVGIQRFYPRLGSQNNGDCMLLIKLGDPEGEDDHAGTFYYSEDCNSKYIAACFTNAPVA